MSDIYGICVGLIGIDPKYYLDEMSQDEVVAVMKAKNENYTIVSRESWEQARMQCFYSVAAMGSKVKKPSELFKFPWDGEGKKGKGITKQEALNRLKGR